MIDRCRFGSERLDVMPWHTAPVDDLARFVARLLTPAVTAALPAEWRGPYDAERAAAWIEDRDAESTVLLAVERSSAAPLGLLIVTAEGDIRAHDLRIGYLLAEAGWGRGLATELIGGLVAWCRAVGTVRSLSGGVEPGNAASVRLLERHGFEAVGAGAGREQTAEQLYRLALDEPAAVTIRPETHDDVDAIRQVVTAAFGSRVEADLVDRIRTSPGYLPDVALVANVGGEIVGHVMISGAVVRHDDGERPIVMLSPLAVAPDHQRRRIGARLVIDAVDRAERRGEPLVVLEGSPAYYARFGFEHSVAHGLSLPLPGWAPSEAGQVALLAGYDPTDATLRGEVVYQAAFDGLG